jgi:hypothetical protein
MTGAEPDKSSKRPSFNRQADPDTVLQSHLNNNGDDWSPSGSKLAEALKMMGAVFGTVRLPPAITIRIGRRITLTNSTAEEVNWPAVTATRNL